LVAADLPLSAAEAAVEAALEASAAKDDATAMLPVV